MSTLKLFVLTVALAGCARKEEPAPTRGSAKAPDKAPDKAAPPAADPDADHVWILASHKTPKPNDPVQVAIDKFKVTKATFDPKNLEGGTASLELDLSSLHTGSDKRDAHLKSESYIDLSKFTTATIDIANVKKTDDKHFTADADVKLRGLEKKYPVTFEVLSSTADSIRIKGEQKFGRVDFTIGKDVKDDNESVAPELTIQLQLTLKKT
jgi:polyisoprenoid-binding protein YceI